MNAELVHRAVVGRCGDEMIQHGFLAEALDDPAACGIRIGHRFECCERLRANDEQRLFRIEFAGQVGKLGPVDVRHAVEAHALFPVGPQCAARHHRPQVRSADTNIDDVGQLLAGAAGDLARVHAVDEFLHPGKHFPDLANAGRLQRHGVGDFRTQRNVQHRAVFRLVDTLTGEHRSNCMRYVGISRQAREQLTCRCVDMVLGVVEGEIASR